MKKDALNFAIFCAKNVAVGSIYMVLFISGTHPTNPCFHKSDAICVCISTGISQLRETPLFTLLRILLMPLFADDDVPEKMDAVESFL
jgi:hypothetical protein